jgi:plasmid stabilization system protein ParE
VNRATWTPIAQSDFDRLDDHYRVLSWDFADRVGIAALDAARFLSDHPAAGPVLTDASRKWRVRGYDVVLIYRIVDEGVEILRMRHARENWRSPE